MIQELSNPEQYKPERELNNREDKDNRGNKFWEKWFAVFSPEETDEIINSQLPNESEKSSDVALFRASTVTKETQEKQWRSWSEYLFSLRFYLEHRILEPLRTSKEKSYDPEDKNSRLVYKPIIKILNRQNLPIEVIRPGKESREFEVDENKINPQDAIEIENIDQLLELRKIFLERTKEGSREYEFIHQLCDELIQTFQEIMEIRGKIEEIHRLNRKLRKL